MNIHIQKVLPSGELKPVCSSAFYRTYFFRTNNFGLYVTEYYTYFCSYENMKSNFMKKPIEITNILFEIIANRKCDDRIQIKKFSKNIILKINYGIDSWDTIIIPRLLRATKQNIFVKNPNIFAYCKYIFTIDENETQNKYSKYIKSLVLTQKKVLKIKEMVNFISLESLEISKCYLREISNLDTLYNLKKLNLSCNEIDKLCGLNNLIKLKILTMHHNKIKIFCDPGTYVLQEIDLSYNLIEIINISIVLNNMINLKLDNNFITTLPYFSSIMPNLVKLDLSFNSIEKIHGLEKMNKINELYLNDNVIWEVSGLEDLTRMTILDLSNNFIMSINRLKDLDNLQTLVVIGTVINDVEETKVLLPRLLYFFCGGC